MEIVPGIHKIDGIRIVNSYLMIQQEKLLVIDTGWPGDDAKTIDYVRKIGRNPEDIKYIILTHADLDHVGCAAELKRKTGGKLAIHALDLPALTGKRKFKSYGVFQPVKWAVDYWMRHMPFQPVEPDIILEHGGSLNGWQIFHAPGHTAGSICLYLPGKAIFVGDAIRTSGRRKPRPLSRRVSLDHTQALKSIKAIAKLDFEVLLPGHGAPIVSGGSRRIRDLAARY